ncbi:MAG: hypothetical protein GY704_09355 [Phycisphaeraceae bacterium]|nr:hypothetical protein [Phycisphaeraceae bacterium]
MLDTIRTTTKLEEDAETALKADLVAFKASYTVPAAADSDDETTDEEPAATDGEG